MALVLVLLAVVIAVVVLVKGRVRSGLTGSGLSPNDQPAPMGNNPFSNPLFPGSMQQTPSPDFFSDSSSNSPASFSGGDDSSSPQPDYSEASGNSGYASDSSSTGYDPGGGCS